MKALLQRVRNAHVEVDNKTVGQINRGILVLLGVDSEDNEHTASKLAEKVLKYRIFADHTNRMNLNIQQIDGDLLIVPQFTLVADTKKGSRPGFSRGASPKDGQRLFETFKHHITEMYKPCQSGTYGANMQVHLCNDGPVTFLLEVK